MLLAGLLFPAEQFAQSPAEAKPPATDGTPVGDANPPQGSAAIVQNEPSFYVHASLDRLDNTYRAGEYLRVNFVSEVDAFAYVIYRQADGKEYVVFPNSVQRDNRIKAETRVTIPADDEQFRWRIGPPFGKEVVRVIASKQPIAALEDPALRSKQFNAITPEVVKSVADVLSGLDPAQWAEHAVPLTTHPAEADLASQRNKRYGVFFGVAQHEFNDEALEASQDKTPLDLAGCANDAYVLGSMMQRMGMLDDVRVYINEKATRWQLEQAITGWLASVSRPGDTVFIGFSGHGSRLPDDNGDESDGADEFLIPNDYVSPGIYEVLVRRRENGLLDNRLIDRLDRWTEIVGAGGARGAQALVRHTAVTDDLLGHWLQRLSGRQVVLIIDACHSGGLVTLEKGATDSGQPRSFDFLTGELGRLKDLGQPESALLVACGAAQLSIGVPVVNFEKVRHAHGGPVMGWEQQFNALGVMTFYLAQSLVTSPRPMTIEQAHDHCRTWMERYRSIHANEIARDEADSQFKIGSEPLLFNYSNRPVLMKP
jgi:hypothetical protein